MDNQKETISKSLLFFNGALVLGVILMIFSISSALNKPLKKETPKAKEKVLSTAFDNVKLEAKSAYVYDVTKGEVIYQKNGSVQLPLASITKLMTALTATEMLPKDSKIVIRKEFLQEDGDSGLLANESWKLKDLLDFSLVVSSNDGARSIASVIGAFDLNTNDYDLGRKDFISKMNTTAQRIGLSQTYFVNESGLDVDKVSGGYGSAEDVSKLIAYMLKNNPEILEATKYQTIKLDSETKTHTAKNTNTYVDTIPGLIASKTGYTDLAGGNLAIAFDPSIGRPIIVVVLGSTEKGRFTDVSTLVNASLAYVAE